MSERIGVEMDLLREVASGTIAKFMTAVAGLVASIVVAWKLGPAVYGSVSLLIALGKLADRPVQGFGRAGKQRIASDERLTPGVFGAQLLVTVGWVAVFAVIAVAIAPVLIDYVNLPTAPLLLVLLVLSDSAFESAETLAQGRGRVAAATWAGTLQVYISAPLQIGLVLLGFGAMGVVFGITTASLLATPVAAYYVGTRPSIPTRGLFENLWAFARSSIPDSGLNTVYERAGILLMGTLLSTTAAGNYQVAWALTLPGMYLAEVAATGLMTKVASRTSERGVREDMRNTLSYSGIFAIPILAGVLALAEPLVVGIYSPQYAAAAPLLVGLAAYRVLRTQSGPVLQAVNGIDRPDAAVRVTTIALAVALVAAVALSFPFGPVGVVAGIVVGDLVRLLVGRWALHANVGSVSLVTRQQLHQVLAAAVMGLVVWGLRTAVAVEGRVAVVAIVGVGGMVYFGALLLSEPHRALAADALGGTPLSGLGRP